MNRKTLIALAAALCMAPGAHAFKDQIELHSYSFGAVAQPDSSPSPARQTTIVQDVGATRPAPTPPTPIGDMTQGTAGTQGLLLPAVQKVREAAARTPPEMSESQQRSPTAEQKNLRAATRVLEAAARTPPEMSESQQRSFVGGGTQRSITDALLKIEGIPGESDNRSRQLPAVQRPVEATLARTPVAPAAAPTRVAPAFPAVAPVGRR